jgi:hypothetical protein
MNLQDGCLEVAGCWTCKVRRVMQEFMVKLLRSRRTLITKTTTKPRGFAEHADYVNFIIIITSYQDTPFVKTGVRNRGILPFLMIHLTKN